MSGFVVFGTLGYIAGMLDKPIEELEAFGYGLTFVAYPEAISTLPGAPIWAVLFFAMLINLGLDTTVSLRQFCCFSFYYFNDQLFH